MIRREEKLPTKMRGPRPSAHDCASGVRRADFGLARERLLNVLD